MTNRKKHQLQKAMAEPRQRFSLRKLSIGTVSVLLGTVFYLNNANVSVHADTNADAETPNVSQDDATSSQTGNSVTLHSQPQAGSSNSSNDGQQQSTDQSQTSTLSLKPNRGGYKPFC